jgi:hypothetical protein
MRSNLSSIFSLLGSTYVGRIDIPPTAMPEGCNYMELQVECSGWTDMTSSATITLNASRDGGKTWGLFTRGVMVGGALDAENNVVAYQRLGIGTLPGELMVKGVVYIHAGTSQSGIVTNGIDLLSGVRG